MCEYQNFEEKVLSSAAQERDTQNLNKEIKWSHSAVAT
jgi:hypothetical protein